MVTSVQQLQQGLRLITSVFTFVPLQLVLGHAVCAAVKVLLQRVHLPAQDVSEGLHLCQLLPQTVTLLEKQYNKSSD